MPGVVHWRSRPESNCILCWVTERTTIGSCCQVAQIRKAARTSCQQRPIPYGASGVLCSILRRFARAALWPDCQCFCHPAPPLFEPKRMAAAAPTTTGPSSGRRSARRATSSGGRSERRKSFGSCGSSRSAPLNPRQRRCTPLEQHCVCCRFPAAHPAALAGLN